MLSAWNLGLGIKLAGVRMGHRPFVGGNPRRVVLVYFGEHSARQRNQAIITHFIPRIFPKSSCHVHATFAPDLPSGAFVML